MFDNSNRGFLVVILETGSKPIDLINIPTLGSPHCGSMPDQVY